MSAVPPPNPNGDRLSADYTSNDGATANPWSDSRMQLVVLGYITAVAMPPIGFILGIVVGLRARNTASKHWMWIIMLSIVGGILWTLVFLSGALSSTSNDLT